MTPLKRTLALWLLFLTAAAVSAHDWSFLAGDTRRQFRLDTHRAVVQGVEFQPTVYRVLVPYSLDPVIRFFAQFMAYEDAFGRVYAVFYLLALAALLCVHYEYFRRHFTDEQALVGALVIAATLSMGLRSYDYAPYSQLEPTLFALALLLMDVQRHAALAVLIAIATLNRETAIFIVLLFCVVVPLTRARLTVAAGYLAIWAATFFGIRFAVGAGRPRYWTIDSIWLGNTHDLNQIVISFTNIALIYGAFWLFAILGCRRAPAFVRRSALIVPLYLATVAVWGIWTEVRLLQPLYPILIPLGLSYLFAPRSDGAQTRGALQGAPSVHSSATSSPTARHDVNPGESMPAA
jgi:hypothetical protein